MGYLPNVQSKVFTVISPHRRKTMAMLHLEKLQEVRVPALEVGRAVTKPFLLPLAFRQQPFTLQYFEIHTQ